MGPGRNVGSTGGKRLQLVLPSSSTPFSLSIQTELLPEADHPLKDSECLQHALALPTGALLRSEQWRKQ